jgi:hypothetical protein
MKTVFLITTLLFAFANSFSQTHVSGYIKSNGTYVTPHFRSTPNKSVLDNYSTKGNVNPFTGSSGAKSYHYTPSISSYSYTKPTHSTPEYVPNYSSRNIYTSNNSTYTIKTIYTGPRGGNYYINSNGNKTYVRN